MTKLNEALREKFLTPQDALRALGLDERLLREDETKPMSKKDEAILAVLEKAMAQDASLGDITKFVEAMTALESGGSAVGSEGTVEEEFGEHDDEDDGEDEIPGAVTEPNSGAPELGEKGEGDEPGEEVATDGPVGKLHSILKGKLSPEELAEVGECLKQIAGGEEAESDEDEGDEHEELGAPEEHEGEDDDSEEDDAEGEDEDKDEEDDMSTENLVTKPAMDEAIRVAVANAEKRAAEKANALRIAERAVEPYVGKLALDAAIDADGVYRKALSMLGVEGAEDVHPSALTLLLKAQPLPGAAPRREPRLAQDAASVKATLDRFPNAGRLKRA
jgi:hypothetical protein